MIDILLLSGFLGSGKTTLLKNLIKSFKNKKIGVIVNEFGKEGVDGKLLKETGLSVSEINDGAIFCACRSDRFIDAILKTKEFDVNLLIVESSGLADPMGMGQIMDSLNKVSPNSFLYKGSVCVIDAYNFPKIRSVLIAARNQVQGSDLILMNKIDLIQDEDKDGLVEMIRELNSNAPIIGTTYCKIEDYDLLTHLVHGEDHSGYLTKKMLGISKLTFKFDEVNIYNVKGWIEEFASQTLRIKGFLRENGESYYIEAVKDVIKLSSTNKAPEENYIEIIMKSNDQVKRTIQESWTEYFNNEMVIL